ncbi:MAG: 1-(5-phosphoribosyl)-5-[(5-phosphoribosylamino)methylideneamino]imidazole-4-carboxamide isomerase [Pseudomonadales bacterium]
MLLIPAIDLKDGKCVRLKQGRMSDVTVFSDDPVAMARHWAEQGCRRLHLVDLDGAFAGEPRNRDIIAAITRELADVPVQVGGGIRTEAVIEAYLDAGIAQVIVGTRAIEEPEFLERIAGAYPQRVILGLDARDGMLATAGWDETSARTAVEFARWAGALDIAAIVYTDIERDGMLSGVNAAATVALAEAAGVPVIASGGVADLADLQALLAAFDGSSGTLLGAITGRAIYAGSLDFRAGQALLDGQLPRAG